VIADLTLQELHLLAVAQLELRIAVLALQELQSARFGTVGVIIADLAPLQALQSTRFGMAGNEDCWLDATAGIAICSLWHSGI
jgi:hypothetical protein